MADTASLIAMLIFAATALVAPAANGHLEDRYSLQNQCQDASFLSVSARKRTRKTVPDVALLLRDSSGRIQGQGAPSDEIPMSRYGEIVQLPKDPHETRELAIEVCNAQLGIYDIEIKEKGTDAYVLDVTGSGAGQDTESLLLHHYARKGITRHYRFVFRRDKGGAVLRWLDEDGEERMEIEPNDW